ncbi:MAG: family 20 glycosylhydrolase [Chloroflexi bacterium]|nr:family 20 glycosylhydrolase [Chloroflexota bacterium]
MNFRKQGDQILYPFTRIQTPVLQEAKIISSINLLPIPRQRVYGPGAVALGGIHFLTIEAPNPQELLFSALRLQKGLREHSGINIELIAGGAAPLDISGITLRISPEKIDHPQGYTLSISVTGITIEGSTPNGVFYGVSTLLQIAGQVEDAIPCMEISDWPDFPARGVMLDVSRDKVPTLETLMELIDLLAGWKINQLQLYTENTFAYQNHPTAWKDASPITSQDILLLDQFCRERFVELVPNQNSFGHLTNWLRLPAYAHLAETHGEFSTPWGMERGPYSLCPIDPGSLQLVESWFDELLPNFSSRMVNVGCDETFDVGHGRSQEAARQVGAERLYLDFLLAIDRSLHARGRTMQFWGDMLVNHPEIIPEVPGDAIALEWGYEANHPFDQRGAVYQSAGVTFYVCPGTSSWNSLAGRTDNALANLLNAAENGLKHHAVGYLITDWGDRGHWQPLPVSYLGFAAGSAYSWSLQANRDLDIAAAISLHAFHDPSGSMGRLAFDLGNVYRAVGIEPENSSALFWILQLPLEAIRSQGEAYMHSFRGVLQAVDQAARLLGKARMEGRDASLVRDEYRLVVRLLRHACDRGRLAFEQDPQKAARLRGKLKTDLVRILPAYRRIWLRRNRPGGLSDSLGRMEKLMVDYED